jgi:ABC-type Fe3+ transport system substrate-binding protein
VFPKDESKLRSGIKAFLDFVRSPEGQQIAAAAN